MPSSEAARPGEFSDALDTLRAELARIDARDLVPMNVDVSVAAMTALGVVPKLAAHRAAMVEWFGEDMAVHADRLEQAARAAWSAHGEYGDVTNGAEIARLSAAVIEQRTLLLADVQSLVARKAVDPGVLDNLQGTKGYANQCFDVLRLVMAVRKNWAAVEALTPLQPADLARAEAITNELATAVGTRDQAGSSPAALLRRQAFTYFVRTYNQIRRMLAFLRFEEGDAEAIAPSLWTGRGGRKRRSSPESATPDDGSPAAPSSSGLPGEHPFAAQ